MSASPAPKGQLIVSWVARLLAAGILGMAAVAKLSSQPDSIALFQTLGAEPWGRFVVGIGEVAAVALLLWPGLTFYGGSLAAVLMVGAVGSHLFKLGIQYNGDPSLFVMAVVTLVAALVVIRLHRPARS